MLRAARYLRVAPWDLLDQPAWWTEVALVAENAERAAEEKANAKANRRRKIGGA